MDPAPEQPPAPATPQPLGGVVHTYLGSAREGTPSDAARGALEHLLAYGSTRRFTDEELARAVRIDPSQIRGLGPSIDALIELLEQRRARILATWDPKPAANAAADAYGRHAQELEKLRARLPDREAAHLARAIAGEQLRDLERLWYRLPEGSRPSVWLNHLLERLREKFEVDQLGARWSFTGRTPLDVPRAIEVKIELEEIERLLKQLREAARTAQPAIVDMEALERMVPPEGMEPLREAQRAVNDLLARMAEQAGLARTPEGGWSVSPRAMRLYQRTLLAEIFQDLQASRSGRHAGVEGPDGAVELPATRAYEFGDSPASMDIPQSLVNAMLRQAGETARDATAAPRPLRLHPHDIVVHRTRQQPKCATSVILDMSGSMRHGGQYIQAKRMGMALEALIRSEYPGDFLQFVEMYTLARLRSTAEVAALLPRPVTIHEPVVRLRADMSDPTITEMDLPQHFTNIARALELSRQVLCARPTPNRQIFLVTDGLPTAHFEGSDLLMLYPPDPRTERATLAQAMRCRDAGITINVFLLPSWSQTEEDVQFAHRLAEQTGGRVLFVAGKELDRFVVWDYLRRRRTILG